jgi:hypothetical protein
VRWVAPEVTTVADDEVVVHDGFDVHRYTDLTPGTDHDLDDSLKTAWTSANHCG